MADNWPASKPAGWRQQASRHSVALISLAVALVALGYNTWRNETTEHQRNVRHAAFLVLEHIGSLQEVVDERHYYLPYRSDPEREGRTRLRGFGQVAMVRDLTALMPSPAPETGEALLAAWEAHFAALDDLDADGEPTDGAVAAERALTDAIVDVRMAIRAVLASLD